MKTFMERTIESHALPLYTWDGAKELLREPNYFEAKRIATQSNRFERMGILVADEQYVYPPQSAFVKSFEKWLAIQKHDVNAVNSLYEWRKATQIAETTADDDIYDLEQMSLPPALQIHVDQVLARKRDESAKLTALRHELKDAIDTVLSAKTYVRATA